MLLWTYDCYKGKQCKCFQPQFCPRAQMNVDRFFVAPSATVDF